MKAIEATFEKIKSNVSEIDRNRVESVLMLYDEKIVYIGDCCIRFDKFKYFKPYLNNALVNVNFTHKSNVKFYEGFLNNNPHVDSVSTLAWHEIDFERYDVVFCVAYREEKLLEFLHEKYGEAVVNGKFKLAVLSLSYLLLAPQHTNPNYIFPEDPELCRYLKLPRPGELYISAEERNWASEWLASKGVQEDDTLYIIIDSSSDRGKVLNVAVYFDFLNHLLGHGSKVLIFDENSLGKEEFYAEWLNRPQMAKMIFAKGLSLRKALCLVGSRYTKLVFGPCTGLMHCASSIYNNYVNNGMDPNEVPLLITYTGTYTKANGSANFWWRNSPLIHCLLLKERDRKKKIIPLNQLNEEEKERDDSLPCSDYTAAMLVEYVNSTRRLRVGSYAR